MKSKQTQREGGRPTAFVAGAYSLAVALLLACGVMASLASSVGAQQPSSAQVQEATKACDAAGVAVPTSGDVSGCVAGYTGRDCATISNATTRSYCERGAALPGATPAQPGATQGPAAPVDDAPQSQTPTGNPDNYCQQTYANDSAARSACTAGQSGMGCANFSGAQKAACEAGADDGSSTAQQMANAPGGSGKKCGEAEVNLISCEGQGATAIGDILKQVLLIMSVGVGILAVGGIVFGAILYASAQDNAGQTQKAIQIITNTVIGLLLYIFMFAIVNWLVPGGVIQ